MRGGQAFDQTTVGDQGRGGFHPDAFGFFDIPADAVLRLWTGKAGLETFGIEVDRLGEFFQVRFGVFLLVGEQQVGVLPEPALISSTLGGDGGGA